MITICANYNTLNIEACLLLRVMCNSVVVLGLNTYNLFFCLSYCSRWNQVDEGANNVFIPVESTVTRRRWRVGRVLYPLEILRTVQECNMVIVGGHTGSVVTIKLME